MVHAERSMTKREFAEIARATLDQMGKSDYKVIMIDSPLEAALETPEMFMNVDAVAYTSADTIYFYWYHLKNYTYSFQLAAIRHEIVHALSPSLKIDKTTGVSKTLQLEWDEYFKSFSFPREEYYSHKVHSEKEYQDLIDYTDENLKSLRKEERVNNDIFNLKIQIISTFDKLDNFLKELFSETEKKPSDEWYFLGNIGKLFS